MYTLPDLPYKENALEPFIDEVTMKLHHSKHHQTYIDKLNEALVGHNDLINLPILDLLKKLGSIPEDIRTKVRNHGGGHANHTMFWKILCPSDQSGKPSGKLLEAIDKTFGSLEKLQEEFNNAALSHFGSGWAWLTVEKGKLHICTTANQDSPITKGNFGILGLDVWEHAYYLKYQNRRKEYIEAFWNIVNWPHIEKHYASAIG